MSRALLSLLAIAAASACGATPTPPVREIALAPPGIFVQGNRLVANGKSVHLYGVNHSGSEYACVAGTGVFEGPIDATLTRAMAAWHVNAVRIPLNEHCWLGINGAPAAYSGAAYRKAIVDFVALVRGAGMYAILDLHWSAPGTTLAKGQQPMADRDHALDFWRSVASEFQGDAGVLFDLFNEPYLSAENGARDPWECWRHGCMITSQGVAGPWQTAGMQELVDAVRSTGARNVIMIGGLAYANDLRGWLSHFPSDGHGQVIASAHVYNFNGCKDASCWNAQLAPLAAQIPLVTGEIGEDDCAHDFIDTYMDWADAHGVSYLGWTWNAWDCKAGPALITGYDGTPTPFGEGLRARLIALPR